MNLEKYKELTGNDVESSDEAFVKAQIRRTRIVLESMLGFSLDKQKASINEYEEKGKTTADCIFRGTLGDIDFDSLDPADDVEGSYRLFDYNPSDAFFSTDPFITLHKVKLVFIKSGEEPNGVTHKTFSEGNTRVHKVGGISKYIENCKDCLCTCLCENCVQLAVDAEWLNEDCLPEELMLIWADMVEYNIDPKRDVVEETLGTHRYKLDKARSPETYEESINIIKRYAGPNGSVNRADII